MSAQRLLSITVLFGVAVTLAAQSTAAAAQDVSVQQLLERGALDEAIQRAEAERDNPESTYLAAQALIKKDDGGRAGERTAAYENAATRIGRRSANPARRCWRVTTMAAMAAAERAVAANGDNPYAHYQVGVVAIRQENFQRAAEAFGRSVELKPDLAYAHYYAGIAYQRVRRSRKCPSISKPSCGWPLMRPSGRPWRQFCGRCEEGRGDPRQKMCPIPKYHRPLLN